MTKEELFNLLINIHPKWRRRIVTKTRGMKEALDILYPSVPLQLQVDALMNNISPYCLSCGKSVKFIRKKTCSHKCYSELETKNGNKKKRFEKRSKTWKAKYHGDHNKENRETLKENRNAGMIKKHGAKVSAKALASTLSRIDNLQVKGRETLRKNYGVDNPGQIPGHYDRVVATMEENYGVRHYAYLPENIQQREEYQVNKYKRLTPNFIDFHELIEDQDKKEVYENPNKLVNFTCNECNRIDSVPTETYKWRIREVGTPCITCSGISHGSRKEQALALYISDLSVDIKQNMRGLLNNLEIDILIPEYNLGIEFNGLFWHNSSRIDKNYHKNKTDLAKEKGLRLIHVFEDEWEHKSDIVKSKIAGLLNKSVSIDINDCILQEITTEQCRQFVRFNNLANYIESNINIGLFYLGNLVTVMSFVNLNNNIYELVNFTCLKNHKIIDADIKLFQHFIEAYSPDGIIGYSDNRWDDDLLYKNLGFIYNNDTPLIEWGIDLSKMVRFNKNELLIENTNCDYFTIWDCGCTRWIWENE